jgi:hypothetical protein
VNSKESGHLHLIPKGSEQSAAEGSAPEQERIEDLKLAVEELRVADGELRQQNEELGAAHLQVDAGCSASRPSIWPAKRWRRTWRPRIGHVSVRS